MITIKDNEGRKEFYLHNGVLLGHTLIVNDQYYFSIHMPEAGIWDAKELRAIADKLNELNGQSFQGKDDDWVRVEDGLPKSGSMVLMAWPNGEIEIHSVGLKEHFKKMPITGWRYLPKPPGQSPTPTTDKVKEELQRHSETWDAACRYLTSATDHLYSGPLLVNKQTYLSSLENKLKQV